MPPRVGRGHDYHNLVSCESRAVQALLVRALRRMLGVWARRRHDRGGGRSCLPEGLAERDANDGPDDRVPMIPIWRRAMWLTAGPMTPTRHIAPASSSPLRTATCPAVWNTGGGEQQGQAEEDVPGDDVDAVEHRWPTPVEQVPEAVNRTRVDPADDGELVAGTGQLGPNRLKPLRQRIGPLPGRKSQDGNQCRPRRVKVSHPEPCHGQVDGRQHAQLEAALGRHDAAGQAGNGSPGQSESRAGGTAG